MRRYIKLSKYDMSNDGIPVLGSICGCVANKKGRTRFAGDPA